MGKMDKSELPSSAAQPSSDADPFQQLETLAIDTSQSPDEQGTTVQNMYRAVGATSVAAETLHVDDNRPSSVDDPKAPINH